MATQLLLFLAATSMAISGLLRSAWLGGAAAAFAASAVLVALVRA